MRYIVVTCCALVAVAGWLFATFGAAHTRIQVIDPRVEGTTGASAVVHATIANRGVNRDRLLRLSSGLAERIVILDAADREIDGLRIPADSELVLGDGIVRIRAIGLTKAVSITEKFPLLFVFEHAGKISVLARVENSQKAAGQ